MSWITLTSTDVLAQFSPSEKSAYQTARAGSDEIPDIINSVSNEVRGYVAVKYPLGSAGTIPESLESAAISIIRFRFLNGLPTKTLITEDRRKENEQAIKLLESVAAGKFVVESPSGSQNAGSNIVISEREKKVTGAKLKGL